ncbi:head-tail connector protein [Acinetobacter pittii]|uniref:head-tail connector protein n=1 Tax=Acinetobacter pittii TaxID=48296 RepID=UPI000CE3521E|nr:head-tail connector protein [Acinetobacter pittii]PPC02515.1 DNA packaging protein [Acinetobacter pittii]WPP78286.1 head-tail connector protein [Acinetobacter pittii]
MSVISINRAMAHLRVDEDIDNDIASKLDSAERIAKEYLNRNFYLDKAALDLAKEEIPSILSEAKTQYDQDVSFANALDRELVDKFILTASFNYDTAIRQAKMISLGILVNPSIEIGVLLILGNLYENREDLTTSNIYELPKGAEWHLHPFRTELGVS